MPKPKGSGKHQEKKGLNMKISNMKGRHSKNKSSSNKRSKNYMKRYRGQGRLIYASVVKLANTTDLKSVAH